MDNLRHAASEPKKLHQCHRNLLSLNTVCADVRSETGAAPLRADERPPPIKRAATSAAAMGKGQTDDQLFERKGPVEETTMAIRAE
jgi:hypothetical protein